MKISLELREQILKEVKEVGNRTQVAKRHNISESTIRGWENRKQNKETTTNKNIEKENKILKKLLIEKELELEILRDTLGKKY